MDINISKKRAYALKDFLTACKNQQEKIDIQPKALIDAESSPLHFYNKSEILMFLSDYDEKDFDYVNTKTYRKGDQGQHPDVDSYLVHLRYWDLYIAFYFLNTTSKWVIKSFHSDNTEETLSIEEICKLRS